MTKSRFDLPFPDPAASRWQGEDKGRRMKVLVTVFSDASVQPETGKSAWGAWVKSERGKVEGGGRFREFVSCTSVSEAKAAVNAINLALRAGVAHPGDIILIQTDNVAVPAVLKGRDAKTSKKHNSQRQEVGKLFAALLEKHRLTWRWRHVKGHQGCVTPRNAVNEICDRICRAHMRD